MRIWFAKKKGTQEIAMTRFEALCLLQEISELINQGRIFAAMEKIGMDAMPFGDEITIDELGEVFQVRVADLAKYAGVKL